jgi:DNA-directed RNA polymerase subunit L
MFSVDVDHRCGSSPWCAPLLEAQFLFFFELLATEVSLVVAAAAAAAVAAVATVRACIQSEYGKNLCDHNMQKHSSNKCQNSVRKMSDKSSYSVKHMLKHVKHISEKCQKRVQQVSDKFPQSGQQVSETCRNVSKCVQQVCNKLERAFRDQYIFH